MKPVTKNFNTFKVGRINARQEVKKQPLHQHSKALCLEYHMYFINKADVYLYTLHVHV